MGSVHSHGIPGESNAEAYGHGTMGRGAISRPTAECSSGIEVLDPVCSGQILPGQPRRELVVTVFSVWLSVVSAEGLRQLFDSKTESEEVLSLGLSSAQLFC